MNSADFFFYPLLNTSKLSFTMLGYIEKQQVVEAQCTRQMRFGAVLKKGHKSFLSVFVPAIILIRKVFLLLIL